MATHFIYTARTTGLPLDDQLKLARSAFPHESGVEVVREGPAQLGVALHLRQAGSALLARLREGDVLAVASLRLLAPTGPDLLELARRLGSLGAHLYAHQDAVPLDTRRFGWQPVTGLLAVVDALERQTRSEEVSSAMALHRRAGRRMSNKPPLGHRWAWRDGAAYAEPDGRELSVIAKVVEWKDRGWTWGQIETHLFSLGETSATGTQWCKRRCQRAYAAHKNGLLPAPPEPAEVDGEAM